jgi:hypothetical protein
MALTADALIGLLTTFSWVINLSDECLGARRPRPG